jgi:hypothetical protein
MGIHNSKNFERKVCVFLNRASFSKFWLTRELADFSFIRLQIKTTYLRRYRKPVNVQDRSVEMPWGALYMSSAHLGASNKLSFRLFSLVSDRVYPNTPRCPGAGPLSKANKHAKIIFGRRRFYSILDRITSRAKVQSYPTLQRRDPGDKKTGGIVGSRYKTPHASSFQHISPGSPGTPPLSPITDEHVSYTGVGVDTFACLVGYGYLYPCYA